MKASIQIPRGWRRLRMTEPRRIGDKVWDSANEPNKWLDCDEETAGYPPEHKDLIYIRKIKARKGKWVPKGYKECSFEQWHNDHASAEKLYRYAKKGTRSMLTYEQWLALDVSIEQTRFFRKADK